MEGKRQRLYCESVGDVTVVNFMDKKILDEANIQEIGDELFDLVDKRYKVKLVLNFENVEFLSSAALGKLITLSKKVQAEKGSLKLCAISPQIYEVFRITKLNKLFDITDTVEHAVAKLK